MEGRERREELNTLIEEIERRVEAKKLVFELGGVVDDDLPAVVGVFKDEGEEAFGDAAVFLAALEMVFADDDGEVLIERMDLEVGVGEGAHRGLVGVVVLVLVEQAGKAAGDLVGDDEGVRRVLEAARRRPRGRPCSRRSPGPRRTLMMLSSWREAVWSGSGALRGDDGGSRRVKKRRRDGERNEAS